MSLGRSITCYVEDMVASNDPALLLSNSSNFIKRMLSQASTAATINVYQAKSWNIETLAIKSSLGSINWG